MVRGIKRPASIVIAVILAAVAARIVWVNVTLPHVSFHRYGVGEWVPLDGAFLSLSGEGTNHYLVRVDDAEVVSVDEYRRTYGDGTEQLGVNGSARCLVVLTLSIKNDGDDQGGFALPRTFLVPKGSEELYYFTLASECALEPLAAYEGPETEDSYARGWGIDPGTQCQVHVAYLINRGQESVNHEVQDSGFDLYLSLHPTCNIVCFEVGGGPDAP